MDEAFGVGGEGCGEHAGAFVADGVGGAVVDVGGNVQAEAGVAVFVVVTNQELRHRPAQSADHPATSAMRVAQIELGEYVTVVANCRNSLKLSETHGADQQDQFVSTAVSQDLVAFFRQRNQTVGLVWAARPVVPLADLPGPSVGRSAGLAW